MHEDINLGSNEKQKVFDLVKIKKEGGISSFAYDLISSKSFYLQMLEDIASLDDYTFSHTLELVRYAEIVSDKLELDYETKNVLILSAVSHDIGKLNDKILKLIKSENELTEEEKKIVYSHPRIAFDILKAQGEDRVAEIIIAHHEQGDLNTNHQKGQKTSYPRKSSNNNRGLRRKTDLELKKLQRIFSIIDKFDGLVSERPYKSPKSISETETKLREVFKRPEDDEVIKILVNDYNFD